MKKWYIQENIYMEDVEFEGTFTEAKRFADERATYTQHPIKIYSENDRENPVAMRQWYDTEATETDENIICFGKFGFYSEWIDF